MAEFDQISTGEMQDEIILLMSEQCNEKIKLANYTKTITCPIWWDGILCWPSSAPGRLNLSPCPSYIVGFHSQAYASRMCFENGTWQDITDFHLCSNNTVTNIFVEADPINSTLIIKYLPHIKALSHVGYALSELALIAAFIILVAFKRLRCQRNMLHLHLFISFIMRGFMGFLKSSLFQQGVGFSSDFAKQNGTSLFVEQEQHNWECKSLMILWQYFIMANYSWILMEGLYIHNLIMFALFSDNSSILIYIALGWGLPSIFVLYWALVRAFTENTLCWTTNANVRNYLIIRIPIMTSILVNFFLFVNIVRLILVKMRTSIQEETERYWKWAKSTLVLVPLFGIHYMVFLMMSFTTGVDERVELVWLFCDQFFASFQGLVLAVLYCFVNREVQEEIRRKWKRIITDNGRVIEHTMSFGSRSSSTSMKPPWSFLRSCRLFRFKRHKPRGTCKRAETVDCIVCESCPIDHNHMPLKQHHPNHEVEVGLMEETNTSALKTPI